MLFGLTSQCFTGDTLVSTETGLIPIEENHTYYVSGHEVLVHNGCGGPNGKGGSGSVPDIGYNSFKDLKADLGSPGEGNAWHHIVEQSQIGKSGFDSNQVSNVNNIISVPHGKGTVHAKISGYYSPKQFFTGGKTVRQWLYGQSFEAQYEFEMNLLKEYGDVAPTKNGWILHRLKKM